MKVWTLQAKLTVWISLLMTGTLIVFGALSAFNLYQEKMEAIDQLKQLPLTKQDYEAEAQDLLGDLFTSYAISLPVAVLLAAVGVWILSRKVLQPLRDMATSAQQIHAKALNKRLPVPMSKDEVGELAVVLNSLIERLEKSFLQSSRFSADASHELKTPLSIMRAELESALKNEPIDRTVLENLLAQTYRITAITTKLLFLARADAGQLLIDSKSVDISSICSDLLEDAEILASARKISVKGHIALGLKFQGDELLLRQALLNLLDNAIKYNLEGGTVEMTLQAELRQIILTITNTGPGIPEAHHSRIFERFYRSDPSRSSETGGNGLGLSLCREIVLSHGGDIHFQSKNGLTSFAINLPYI